MAKNEQQEKWETDYVDKVDFLRELAKERAEYIKSLQGKKKKKSSKNTNGDSASVDAPTSNATGDFDMTYQITQDYLPKGSKRRSGEKMDGIKFIVAHDTGTPNSTAAGNVKYYKNSANSMSASAHFFVDATQIIECIPVVSGTPEKAWHVQYGRTEDNAKYGDDANDVAVGIEFCYSTNGSFDNEESYKRYVWLMAFLCRKYNMNPSNDIIGHQHLDPARRSDPSNALSKMGKSFEGLIKDVQTAFNGIKESGGSSSGGGGGDSKASVKNGKVIPMKGDRGAQLAKRKEQGISNNWSGYKKLDTGLFKITDSGTKNRVAPDANPAFSLLAHSILSKTSRKKVVVTSVWRDHDTDKAPYSPHLSGIAIDIEVKGFKDALKIADIAWSLGFRAVGVGGNLEGGGGLVHVDIGPASTWAYSPYPAYKGPNSWGDYR